MAWYDIFGGGGYQLPPEVQKYLKQYQKSGGLGQQQGYQQGLGYLQQLFQPDSESMSAFNEPAMRQFQQEIIPAIAERFSLGDEKGSSGFQNTLAQAGGNLAAMLNQQREQIRQQSLPQLLGYLQAPQQQTQSMLYGAPWAYQQSPWSQLFQGAGKLGSQALMAYLGG